MLDLDNTLWGGVIGDDGVGGIVLGQGAEGEAFVDFQAALKELTARGIVLAVASKNDPEVARRPFLEHPEMVLKLDDIAAFVASWGPKSASIAAIAETLSLGLSSLTFLDDNPYERAEVRRALPEVDVPVLPEEPTGFRAALEDYPYLEPASFTEADRARAEQYRARARAEAIRVHGRLARGIPGEPEHGGADRPGRRGQHGPRRAADQQDQPVQPDDAAAQPGRARGVPGRGRAPRRSGCGSPTSSPTTG